jgi:hypothetical protein
LSIGLLCLFASTDHLKVRGLIIVFGAALSLLGTFFAHFAIRLHILSVRVIPHGLDATAIFGRCALLGTM